MDSSKFGQIRGEGRRDGGAVRNADHSSDGRRENEFGSISRLGRAMLGQNRHDEKRPGSNEENVGRNGASDSEVRRMMR